MRDIRVSLRRIEAAIAQLVEHQSTIESKLDEILALLTGAGEPHDLEIRFGRKGESKMAKIKMKSKAKRGTVGHPMPAVKLSTIGSSVSLVVVDSFDNPIGTIDPAAVTTTFTSSDEAQFTLTQGKDSLSWEGKALVPKGNVTLTATLTYNDGSAGPFTATVDVELDVAQVPADLHIVFVGA